MIFHVSLVHYNVYGMGTGVLINRACNNAKNWFESTVTILYKSNFQSKYFSQSVFKFVNIHFLNFTIFLYYFSLDRKKSQLKIITWHVY